MELWRPAARATIITFPLLDSAGVVNGEAAALDSEWVAWSDTAGPSANGNPGFQDMAGEATAIAETGLYTLAVAAAELPAASPYVLIRVITSNLATQYILLRTASQYANVTAINHSAIASPATAGYMPIDVKQTFVLSGLTDNTIEKALAIQYFATGYATVNDMWTTALTESYSTDGSTMTGAQALYQIWAMLAEVNVSSTTVTASKLDGTTTAMTFTINDATNPTDITRAS